MPAFVIVVCPNRDLEFVILAGFALLIREKVIGVGIQPMLVITMDIQHTV